MINKIKIQHYVPIFYLRNFALKKGNVYITNCFDKSKERKFPVDIKRIGAEKYFYDTHRDTNQIIEKTLGCYESKFGTAYNKIIKKEKLDILSEEEKKAIAFFIATQELRTRETRETIKDLIKQLSNKLSKEKLSADLSKKFQNAQSEESTKITQIGMLIKTVPILASIMLNMKWIIAVNQTSLPFWTSDQPVTRYNPINLSPYGNLGLICRGIQLFFPLSTKVTLFLCDPKEYHLHSEKDELKNIQHVIFLNHLQVKFSTRHIFSINQDFSLAEKMIKDIPELRNIDRMRIKID